MEKSERIVRYTAADLDEMLARGEDMTDWAYVDSLTEEEIEASIDWEDEGRFEWSAPYPGPSITIREGSPVRLDRAIVGWFRAYGNGYRAHIGAVLRNYVDAHNPGLRSTQQQRRAS